MLLRILNARNYIGYRKADYNIFNVNITKEGHFSEIYKEALAQSVEQRTFNPLVEGSNPSRPTT